MTTQTHITQQEELQKSYVLKAGTKGVYSCKTAVTTQTHITVKNLK